MWRSFVLCTIWASLTTHQCLSPLWWPDLMWSLWKNCCASHVEHPAYSLSWDWVPLQSQRPTLLAWLLEPQRTSGLPHTGSRGLECALRRERERRWGLTHEGHSLGLGHPSVDDMVGPSRCQGSSGRAILHGGHSIHWVLGPGTSRRMLLPYPWATLLFSGLAHCVFDHGDEIHSLLL